MNNPNTQNRIRLSKLERIAGGVTFALFIIGLIWFIVGLAPAVVAGLDGVVIGGDFAIALGLNVVLWVDFSALLTGTIGRRDRLGNIGIIGAIVMLALYFFALFALMAGH